MILDKYVDNCNHSSHSKFALFSYFGFPNSKLYAYLVSIKNKLSKEIFSNIEKINSQEPVYGIGKIRGVFDLEKDAEEFAENLIRETECDESIYRVKVGYPFFIAEKGYSQDVKNIDINEKLEEHEKKKKQKQKKDIQTIKEKETQLKINEEKDLSDINDLENYITYRVKLAHLKFTIEKTEKSLQEYYSSLEKCKDWLLKSQSENPSFSKEYLERYLEARREANIEDSSENSKKFIEFMSESL